MKKLLVIFSLVAGLALGFGYVGGLGYIISGFTTPLSGLLQWLDGQSTGTTLLDESGNGNTATSDGTPSGAYILDKDSTDTLTQDTGSLSHSGLFSNEVVYSEAQVWVSGNDNTWIEIDRTNSTILWEHSLIYTNGWSPTLAEYEAISNAYPNTYGAGIIEPLRDVNGDVIYDVDGEIIFVQPEATDIFNAAWYLFGGGTGFDASTNNSDPILTSSAVVFDGVGDKANINSFNGSMTIKSIMEMTIDDVQSYPCELINVGAGLWGDYQLKLTDASTITYTVFNIEDGGSDSATVSVDWSEPHTIKTDGVLLYLDDTCILTSSYPHSDYYDLTSVTIGTDGTGYGAFTLSSFKLYDFSDVLKMWNPCEEDDGSTLYDVSGNANHLDITSTSGLSTMRGGEKTGESYCLGYGFSTMFRADGTYPVDLTADLEVTRNNATVEFYVKHSGSIVMLHGDDSTESVGMCQDSSSPSYGGCGTPTVYSNDVVIGSTRTEADNATRELNRLKYVGCDLSSWTEMNLPDPDYFPATMDMSWLKIDYDSDGTWETDLRGASDGSVVDTVSGVVYATGSPVTIIPALSDGTADALGNAIGNPAGDWHNGAPVTLTATGGISTTNTLWTDGTNYVEVSYADLIATTNAATTVTTNAYGITEIIVEEE